MDSGNSLLKMWVCTFCPYLFVALDDRKPYVRFLRSLCIFMTKIMQLHVQVMAFVMDMDHIMLGRCSRPCSIKAKAPIAIIRNAGTEMPSVLRVRMVVIACGR